ncbi:MAG: CRISPR-associated helicase Cas3' [Rubrivivax sp.]|nr:CRISPR-associated helicase Cas3' [Rubrivivax sp.]
MTQDFLAHTHTEPGSALMRLHGLADHLNAVANTAAQFGQRWGADWAWLAGLWHDLGKFRPGFQRYIRLVNDAHIEGKLPSSSDKTHSAAGALHALRMFEQTYGRTGAMVARPIAYVIAGHHAGLADWTAGLDTRLLGTGAAASELEYAQTLSACSAAAPELLTLPTSFELRAACSAIPGVRDGNPLAWSLWVRMLFSALVDADFLDTEAFMDAKRSVRRQGYRSLDHYQQELDTHLAEKAASIASSGRSEDPVMHARAEVLRLCRDKAGAAPGVFTLTVPTGGGKTLSSLAFALKHAVRHGMQRVIYAIPYTSIIEQTADVFGQIFGPEAMVEHHSQAEGSEREDTARSRLACENWDAPLIVTTNVQLFESLFAARTSRCRKLHRIAGSVIVLDEAQLLPPDFLQPILDTLNVLVSHYGVTLLLCTATQPALGDVQRFDRRQDLRGLPRPTAIIDNEAALFAQLKRVRIEWPDDLQAVQSTPELAQRIAAHECVLTIVNTRKDASEIVTEIDAIGTEEALHLSAAMCGQHRADVIRHIRQRLADRRAGTDMRPLRVVSTQLVEAGVDIDFPVVFRALAGLDSIAQAAGRCNREGLQAQGLVVVFVRKVPTPLTQVRAGIDATRSTLALGLADALAPAAFERYFPLYYAGFASRDKRGIVDDLRNRDDFAMAFRTAADKFKLVDDEQQATVIVPYLSDGPDATDTAPLIARLRHGDTDRWLLRKLQRYTVTVRQNMVNVWQGRGDVHELQPGLYLLVDELRYDRRYGLMPEGQMLNAMGLVA